MAVSMRDVAARAGVSQRTVSNVVRGYVHVRPETRSRVQQAINELNYRPNVAARSLREGRSRLIGLAVPEIDAPYFAELASLVQRRAAASELTLLIDQTGATREHELRVLEGYGTHVIDGLILSPMAIAASDLTSIQPGLPVVLLGEHIQQDVPYPNVAIDNVAAALMATRLLLERGRRRVAAVGVNLDTMNAGPAAHRLEGYLRAHHLAGSTPAEGLQIHTDGWTREAGRRAIADALVNGLEFDALFCFNDLLAFGAIRALADAGVRVPDDVLIVGWDDIEDARFATPSLSSVAPDKQSIAQQAVDLLVRLIRDPQTAARATPPEYSLQLRETTGD
jgi:DNA-binding LacI/PurR family transcriptional regulator